jgi:CheY-like chemotaxis protein
MAEVLVVDDDADIRDTLRLILEDVGHEVLEAEDGRPALTLLCSYPAGLVVLLDLTMPNLDGQAVLEALQAQPKVAARHAVLLLTAQERATDSPPLARLLTALAVPVLTKPVDLDHLVAEVRKAETRLAHR